MNRTGGQTRKQTSPSFFHDSSSLNIHRTEVVHAGVCERKLTQCKSIAPGKDTITGISGFALLLLQCRQSLTIVLMNHFPRGIQNCWCTRAKTCSLPTWKCFLWRSWTSNLYKGCFGETSTWCFASKGIRALSSRPPSVRTGRKGRSELLLRAWVAWRSLYPSPNDLIWAILHEANDPSLRSSAVEILICHPGGAYKAFPSRVLLPFYYNHRRSDRGC